MPKGGSLRSTEARSAAHTQPALEAWDNSWLGSDWWTGGRHMYGAGYMLDAQPQWKGEVNTEEVALRHSCKHSVRRY